MSFTAHVLQLRLVMVSYVEHAYLSHDQIAFRLGCSRCVQACIDQSHMETERRVRGRVDGIGVQEGALRVGVWSLVGIGAGGRFPLCLKKSKRSETSAIIVSQQTATRPLLNGYNLGTRNQYKNA